MLLTLATQSLSSRITPSKKGNGALSVLEVPDYAITHLQLRGMNLPASMLAGWSLERFDQLRDRADKAGCPCLVLVEDSPLPFAHKKAEKRDAAGDRVRRLATAAQRLGCNALAISFAAPDTDDAFDLVAAEVRSIMPELERMELNVLLAPNEGLTQAPDRLTELIKRIGGFRIGSLPSFEHAASTGDVVGTLRKLAPYAGAVHASVMEFSKDGKHAPYDLAECVSAIRSVGFVNTLAIDYRGKGDPEAAIDRARDVLQEAIDADD